MNDNELNEMLSRNDDEANVFRNLDIAREQTALEHWRATGNWGKPPQQLMQLEELPECCQTDEPFDIEVIVEGTKGRGQRKRNTDIARERTALENWQAAGNWEKPPPQLMQLEELLECSRCMHL
jgi:hypothetical protein